MSFYDEFLKAANDEQNGKITRDELISIVKKLISETMPNVSEDKLAELAQAALDPTKSVVVVTSSDGSPYVECVDLNGGMPRSVLPEFKEPGNKPVWIYDRFTKAVCEFRDGIIVRDRLLEEMTAMAAEANPDLSNELISRLGEAMTDAVNCNDISLDHDLLEKRLPDGYYCLPDLGGLKVGKPKEENMDITPETKAKLDKLLARVDELIEPVDTVRLKPSRGKTTVFDSKLGGVPYFPKNMKYPTVREGEFCGKPLFFLAQLNFGELPNIPGFPTEGILQFFTGCTEDTVIGMDFDNGFNQNGFRVIYHENVITDKSALYSEKDMPDFGEGDDYFPFKGEFKLLAERAEPMGIPPTDFRFDKVVVAAYNELFDGDVIGMWGRKFNGKSLNDVDKPLCDAIYSRDGAGTRMGGYPVFTQEDPRGYNEEYSKCTVMLFQSDSESGGEKDNWDDMICWGDLGVANFFISPENLARRDFSHVLYNWDCG